VSNFKKWVKAIMGEKSVMGSLAIVVLGLCTVMR